MNQTSKQRRDTSAPEILLIGGLFLFGLLNSCSVTVRAGQPGDAPVHPSAGEPGTSCVRDPDERPQPPAALCATPETPDFVRRLAEAGQVELSVDELVRARARGLPALRDAV